MKHTLNSRIKGMVCLKCGQTFPVGDYFYGCPSCLEKGENAALTFEYEGEAAIDQNASGWKRYAWMLPYADTVRLGEGDGGSDNGVCFCRPGGATGCERIVVRFRLYGTIRSDGA